MTRPRRAPARAGGDGSFANLLTYPEYQHAHELAVLALLLETLDVVTMVVLAENPELGDDDRPSWRPLPPTVPAANILLRQIDRLRRGLLDYWAAALPPPSDLAPDPDPGEPQSDPADDIPF